MAAEPLNRVLAWLKTSWPWPKLYLFQDLLVHLVYHLSPSFPGPLSNEALKGRPLG